MNFLYVIDSFRFLITSVSYTGPIPGYCKQLFEKQDRFRDTADIYFTLRQTLAFSFFLTRFLKCQEIPLNVPLNTTSRVHDLCIQLVLKPFFCDFFGVICLHRALTALDNVYFSCYILSAYFFLLYFLRW